ncbi:MAG: DinB family protein [Planctomycetota bacterium]
MPTLEINVPHEFTRLQEALDAFESIRAEGADACRRREESVSAWSVEQHLYHIALATDLAFKHVRSLVAGKGRLIADEGELGAQAAEVLASDRTPRGEAKAPRMVTPDPEVDPSFLEMELRLNREGLESLRAMESEIADAPGWIPHQVLGTLSAGHWLRFAALHARHHWSIVRDIRGEGAVS